MRNFNKNTIRDAVLERIEGTTDPRVGRMVKTEYFHLNYDFGLKQVASSARAA